MGSGRRQISTPRPRRSRHHSTCGGVKVLAGKISHLWRENNIRWKKNPSGQAVWSDPMRNFSWGQTFALWVLVSRLRLRVLGCMYLCWGHYCRRFNKAGPKGKSLGGEKKKILARRLQSHKITTIWLPHKLSQSVHSPFILFSSSYWCCFSSHIPTPPHPTPQLPADYLKIG